MDLIPWRHKRPQRAELASSDNPLGAFRGEIDNLFDHYLGDPWGGSLGTKLGPPLSSFPQFDLSESDNEVTLRAELPGLEPDDIRVEVTGNALTLSGEKSSEKEEQRGECRYSERQFGSFSRTIPLPVGIEADKVDATFAGGVLTVRLPKSADAQPRRVKVRNA